MEFGYQTPTSTKVDVTSTPVLGFRSSLRPVPRTVILGKAAAFRDRMRVHSYPFVATVSARHGFLQTCVLLLGAATTRDRQNARAQSAFGILEQRQL